MGYISSDWEEDGDDPDELDEEEITEECLIAQKLYDGNEELELHEMETVSLSARLRDSYNHRWWNLDQESYFIYYNYTRRPIEAGKQLTYKYGNRSSDFLVEK